MTTDSSTVRQASSAGCKQDQYRARAEAAMSTRQRTSLRGSALRAVENQSFAVDNLDILGDRDRREGVVSGNHYTAVRGVGEVLERLDRVRLERAVEDEETGKDEFRLDLVTRDAGRLVLVHTVDPLVTEREDTRATLGEPLVRLFVVGRDRSVHALERLRRALDGDESANVGRTGLDERDGRHALELRRELEAAADGNRDAVLPASALPGRRDTVARVELPLERVESCLFHRVSDDTVVKEDERVSRGEGERSFQAGLVDRNQLLAVRSAVQERIHLVRRDKRQSSGRMTYSTPAIPSTTRFSPVMVPVLSKQQMSTRPANGMRNGSVQKIAAEQVRVFVSNKNDLQQLSSLKASSTLKARRNATRHSQYLLRATRLALTAIESSMGSSGGTTEVMMMTQSSRSLERLRSCSRPVTR